MVAVLEKNHLLNDEELEYTQIMANILSIYCEREYFDSLDSEYNHHHIIQDLIFNKISSKEELEKRMYERNWKASNKYRVYMIDITNFNNSYSRHIANYIKSVFTNCKAILYDSYILLLEQISIKSNQQL